MQIITNTIEIKLSDGSHATRTHNAVFPFTEWKRIVEFNGLNSTYSITIIYSYFYGSWHKMKQSMDLVRLNYIHSNSEMCWIECDIPECEEEYQKYLREEKLKRITK